MLIQRGEETSVYRLEDAKAALMNALGRDKKDPDALIELGYYCWVMEDDARAGLEYFDRAIESAERFLNEAREGREKCLEELADLADED